MTGRVDVPGILGAAATSSSQFQQRVPVMATSEAQGLDKQRPIHGDKGLVRTLGALVVALSAVAQEYGSGINFVMPRGLESYPGVEGLVPLAMLVAGLVLIPEVVLFVRYSAVMPRAGSTYVWLTRGLGPYAGFAIAFLWFVGLCGATGFLAFATGTFIGDAAHAMGMATPWFTTRGGHLVIGLATIGSIALLHVSGVKNYGRMIYAAGVLVAIAAALVIVTGFATTPEDAMARLADVVGFQPVPRPSHPSWTAFLGVTALFLFAYGGLEASTSLGGEVADARRNMPRGIVAGWAIALVLYTLIAFALFHAVPWWSAASILESGHGYLLTTPALIGLLAPRAIAVFLNILVAIIVAKTIAPQLLDASRYLFAWAEDGFLPQRFATTNAAHAPAPAIVLAAGLSCLFLVDAVFGGWQIGVALRAVSIAIVFAALGLATALLAWWPRWRRARAFAADCTRGGFVRGIAVCAVVLGVVLIAAVVDTQGVAWYFQPWFQLAVAALAAVLLTMLADWHARRQGKDFFARFRIPPAQ